MNGLRRNAIRIETAAGEVLTGNDLRAAHFADQEAYVYLYNAACEQCQRHQNDCQCEAQIGQPSDIIDEPLLVPLADPVQVHDAPSVYGGESAQCFPQR